MWFSLLSLSLTSHSCSSVELTDDKEYQARLISARSKCVLRQDDTFGCMMWYELLRVDEEMPSALLLHQILFMLDGDGKLVQRVVVWSSSVLGCLSYP